MFRDILCIISLFNFASSNYDGAPTFEDNCQNQATSSNLQKDCFCYGEPENDLDFTICNIQGIISKKNNYFVSLYPTKYDLSLKCGLCRKI